LVIKPNAAGSSFQLDQSILDLIGQSEPMLLGMAWHHDLTLLGLAEPPGISNFIFISLDFFSFILFNFVFHKVKRK